MSQTIASAILGILAVLLPVFGIEVGTEQLTEVVQAIVVLGSFFYIWYRRTLVGDVNIVGARK